jgi:sugar-specific transcriptional regulator TrmB
LNRAAALLAAAPRTAAEIAEALEISRPTAYALLRDLDARRIESVRQGKKGPPAAKFVLP